MSAEIVERAISLEEAQRIDQRIRLKIDHAKEQLDDLQNWIDKAQQGRIWEVLGFTSWTVYLADLFGTPGQIPTPDVRRELGATLIGSGVSKRQTAKILGVAPSTVREDLKSTGRNRPVDLPDRLEGADGKSRPANRPSAPVATKPPMAQPDPSAGEPEVSIIEPATGEIHTDPEHHYRTEGLHGYVPPEIPEPSKPHTERRKPWNDMADAAILQLDSAVKAIEALVKDDRFSKYKGDATKTARYIALDRDALSRVIDQFN